MSFNDGLGYGRSLSEERHQVKSCKAIRKGRMRISFQNCRPGYETWSSSVSFWVDDLRVGTFLNHLAVTSQSNVVHFSVVKPSSKQTSSRTTAVKMKPIYPSQFGMFFQKERKTNFSNELKALIAGTTTITWSPTTSIVADIDVDIVNGTDAQAWRHLLRSASRTKALELL